MSQAESHRYALLDDLVAEFTARFRAGERPSLKEYLDRYPDLADDIKDLFPALVEMEQADDERQEAGTSSGEPPPFKQFGDFRILREIGQGGMGIVYEAEQISLGRHVALKVLPRKMLTNPRARQRFEREARAAAKLHHTNIVPVFGVGEHEGLPFYVMQFIHGLGMDLVLEELKRFKDSGGNLGQVDSLPNSGREEYLRRRRDISAADMANSLMSGGFLAPGSQESGARSQESESKNPDPWTQTPDSWSSGSITLPGRSDEARKSLGKKKPTYWQSVASLGVQVADALDHAHKQGIVHRDIKPSNLLLDMQGTVWVTDLGLAKADDHQDLTNTGDLLGTLRYMPPEAFEGKSDARGDVYSLGLTLYELLAFRPANNERDRPRLVKQVTNAEAARLGRVNPEVPRDLETIVQKTMDRDPAQRYQTAGELAADLQRFLDDEPIRARRQTLTETAWRWARRNKALASLLAAVSLLLVAITIGSLFVAAHFRDQEIIQRELAESNQNLAEEKTRLADEKEGERAKAEEARKREAERSRELRQNLYYAEMNLAGQAAHSPSGLGLVNDLLSRWRLPPPDLRGWEWYYLSGLGHRDLLTLRGHKWAVTATAWSPDGKSLASASVDGTVKVWDAATGQDLRTFRGHVRGAHAVAWSPDSQRLATVDYDNTVKVWDLADGRETVTFRSKVVKASTVAWSPDGTRLAAGGADHAVMVWDLESGKGLITLRGHLQVVMAVAWSPDGTRLASASDDANVKVWDVAAGKETLNFRGHTSWPNSVAWSPDSKLVATGSWDHTVKVWDPTTGAESLTFRGHSDTVRSVAWSPDGQHLASASMDRTVKVFNAVSGKETLSLRGHVQVACSVAWSPEGTQLASAAHDGTVKIWDARRVARALSFRNHAREEVAAAWSPDGQRLATDSDEGLIKVWDAATGKETLVRKHGGVISAVAWSPDGSRLASGGYDKFVKVWDAAHGQELLTLKGHTEGVTAMAWSPDGQRLATGSFDLTAKIWDAAGGQELLTLRGHAQKVAAVAWSPDSTRLATASWDATVKIWDAATGQEAMTLRGHSQGVVALAWGPQGDSLASGSSDHTGKVWDARTSQVLVTLRGHTMNVNAVKWSPDGTRLATASSDRTVKIWDSATGKETLSLADHTHWVMAAAWSPDGTRLMSAGRDHKLFIYDATIGYARERSPWLLSVLERRLADDPKKIEDWRLSALILAQQGDWDKAAEAVRHYLALCPDPPPWFATDWWISQEGTRDEGEGMKNFIPPSSLPNGQVVLRDVNGLVNFRDHWEGHEPAWAYALLAVYSPKKQPAWIVLGSSGPLRLWHNGHLTHEAEAVHPAEPDQEAVPVVLEPGWNTLLVRTASGKDEHLLYLRVTDQNPPSPMR